LPPAGAAKNIIVNMNNYMRPSINDPTNGINFLGASPIANTPRRVFGGYPTNGSPISANSLPPGMFADDLAVYGIDDSDHHGDPKRRRIARVLCPSCVNAGNPVY
jgi:hypothetical protein